MQGVVRTDVLRQTRLIGSYSNSADNLLAELALRGQVYEVPKALFFHRVHDQQSTTVYADRLARVASFDPVTAGHVHFPFCRQFREYAALIGKAPLSIREKRRCYVHLIEWFWQYRRWRRSTVLSELCASRESFMGREAEEDPKPRARNKRVWASVQRAPQEVTEEASRGRCDATPSSGLG